MMLRSWIRRRLTHMARRVTRPFRPALVMLEDRTVPSQIGDVFYIDLENHNFTQPNGNVDTGSATLEQIDGNLAAPFINSLITPGNPNAAMVSYATNYHNVLSTPSGNNPSIHPSEPNYVWQESGTTGPLSANDADPFPSNVVNAPNLTALLQSAGIGWMTYQEDIDLLPTSGSVNQPGPNALTSTVALRNQWTVPLTSFSGTLASGTNSFNGSNQYAFAAKHDGTLFFTATNGGDTPTPSNLEAAHYAPLQQLAADLASNSVGRYNLITPDLFNDMHNGLIGGFSYHGVTYTGDAANIAEGDNFLSMIVPTIEASAAFQNNGMIVIWTDETQPQNTGDTTFNDFNHDLTEIVISPLAKGSAFASTLDYTHSSDLKTLQEIFGVQAPGGFLGDANAPGTNDLSDLLQPGTIPLTIASTPQPASATVGTAIADRAAVSGGLSPTGTVTFNLFSNPSGTGTPLFTDTETLVNGMAISKAFTTTATGTDYWVATYNGDGTNASIGSGAANGPVTISVPTPPPPTSTAFGLHFASVTGRVRKGRRTVDVQLVDASGNTFAEEGVTITLTDTFVSATTHHKKKRTFTAATNSGGSAQFTVSTAGRHSLLAAASGLQPATESISVKP